MRTTSQLNGRQSASSGNTPVSLVSIEISGNPFYMTDGDVDVFLNLITGGMQAAAGDGFTRFSPYPGLKVPQISLTR